ncbi:hypothetical protein EUX98_g1100 [Antrodiella citrinella]|uniref:Uncharacterized protein n=1 Tax=Antrodiella citrinella TaxID=2447956 RepID=A0A4S4NAT4_9APHY|nr:hypothetical protein EUX98_g1100 [Antrodiella citrinella]
MNKSYLSKILHQDSEIPVVATAGTLKDPEVHEPEDTESPSLSDSDEDRCEVSGLISAEDPHRLPSAALDAVSPEADHWQGPAVGTSNRLSSVEADQEDEETREIDHLQTTDDEEVAPPEASETEDAVDSLRKVSKQADQTQEMDQLQTSDDEEVSQRPPKPRTLWDSPRKVSKQADQTQEMDQLQTSDDEEEASETEDVVDSPRKVSKQADLIRQRRRSIKHDELQDGETENPDYVGKTCVRCRHLKKTRPYHKHVCIVAEPFTRCKKCTKGGRVCKWTSS